MARNQETSMSEFISSFGEREEEQAFKKFHKYYKCNHCPEILLSIIEPEHFTPLVSKTMEQEGRIVIIKGLKEEDAIYNNKKGTIIEKHKNGQNSNFFLVKLEDNPDYNIPLHSMNFTGF